MEESGLSTIGDTLRRTREQKKLTIEVVHRATKISPPMIHALEDDDYGVFTSEVYLKSFLRTYAVYLGLDGGELLRTLENRQGERGGGATWDVEESLHEEKLQPSRMPRRILVGVLIGIIVVLVALLVQQRRNPPAAVGAVEEEAVGGVVV